MSVLLVVIMLVLLIVAHELGHFIAAKILGVKVEEFGVGYPPRALTFGTWGGTEYTLNWLPFGGFVKLFGEHPDGSKRKRTGAFVDAPRSSQAIILVAGVAANVLLAWVIFTGGFMLGMPTAVSEDTPGAKLYISGVVAGSPAAQVGLRSGDQILSVIADDGTGAAEVTPTVVSHFVSLHGGDELTVTYLRDAAEGQVVLTPAHAVVPEAAGRPTIGVHLTTIAEKQLSLVPAIIEAGKHTVYSLAAVTIGLAGLARDAFLGTADISSLVGPVGLVGVVGDAVGHGIGHLLGLAAFISVNLAIINLIPIPALDGGRLLFVGIETLIRRRVPEIVFGTVNLIGFALIIVLMIGVTYHDILRLF